ncbi:hypothetical protein BJY01DRAFT_164705 [Aspergillus pseudoustus]|uniref:Zn(2)-C6 fungal-type domain-containing protein n=1 Tax=Aspergillus pseudoustus TaxID=1810923 RepID=A0ABR4IA12_9EURO
MVNRGRSGGCVTCKQRRVKCNEARPECGPCQRLGFPCGGYKSKYANLKFKDETAKFCAKLANCEAAAAGRVITITEQKPPPPRRRSGLVLQRPLAEPDTAVPFYLQVYASAGRDLGAARGFFEMLIPVYTSQPQNSALSLAVSAVAEEVLSLWRHDDSFQSARSWETYHTRAVKSLRSALQDRNEWGKPATTLAVLALQWYENIAAIYGLRSATRIHHNGAMSLLPFADPDCTGNAKTSAYVRRFILHTEISSAMRQERPLQEMASSWIKENSLIEAAAPDNPSFTLDTIGASVAELQARYVNQYQSADQTPRDWIAEAQHLDEQLVTWAQNVPVRWQPRKLISGRDLDPSILAYRSVAEIYPSCQIGAIWNLWRVQRLLLIRIILNSLRRACDDDPAQPDASKDGVSATIDDTDLVQQLHTTLQTLVDSICHSVPFYLGNRTRPSSIADFTDPTILLPSCQPQVATAIATAAHSDDSWIYHAPGDEKHKQHIIAQGPWHLMSPLSRLLTLFSEDDDQQQQQGRSGSGLGLETSVLRPGQYEWICEQFLRVTVLLRILPGRAGGGRRKERSIDNRVECLAQAVRKGAIFMSGP